MLADTAYQGFVFHPVTSLTARRIDEDFQVLAQSQDSEDAQRNLEIA